MSTPINPTVPIPDTDPDRPAVAVRVQAALNGLRAQLGEVYDERPTTDADWALRCVRLAVLHARCAGWWRVLSRAARRENPAAHRLFAQTARIASDQARDRARFWRETGGEFRARAEGRPTSDAAGALSNWHELGVTA